MRLCVAIPCFFRSLPFEEAIETLRCALPILEEYGVTLMPIQMESRKRYFWLTFDRRLGSDFNWSYGNLYCFEAFGLE